MDPQRVDAFTTSFFLFLNQRLSSTTHCASTAKFHYARFVVTRYGCALYPSRVQVTESHIQVTESHIQVNYPILY